MRMTGGLGDCGHIRSLAESWPQDYLDIAAGLRPLLESIDGFISVERFESLTEPGKILSLSFFRDETAVAAWRNTKSHRMARGKGRSEVFANYRLRVAGVIRDYGMHERSQVPSDSAAVHT
jgi:heme-degrading monooxygenase HmoA